MNKNVDNIKKIFASACMVLLYNKQINKLEENV